MKKAFPVVPNSGFLLIALFMAFSAGAADITTWQPTTASGGAPVAPGYWDQQASYQFFGGGPIQNNNSLSVTQMGGVDSINNTSIVDYSTSSSNTTSGAQTNYTPISRDGSTMSTNTADGDQTNYTPISQDSSTLQVTTSTTTNK